MKIAIVVSTFPPYQGGIGNVAYNHAAELSNLGYDVTVFTLGEREGNEAFNFKVKALKPLILYGNAGLVPKLGKLLKGFDVIHLHYPFFGGAEIIWLKAKHLKKHGSKIILHYHMDTVGRGWQGAIFAWHRKFITPKIIAAADKVVGTSKDYLDHSHIANLVKANPRKFVIIPNGVDTRRLTDKNNLNELPHIPKVGPNEKMVLFVGGLDSAHYFKGVEILLKAFKLLIDNYAASQIKLVIVGDGDLRPRYESLASQLNLFEKVIFAGTVASNDIAEYYQRADVTVLPSVDASEAFGMVLIESLSCGTPVIASDLAGVRSVVTNDVGLLCQPKNFQDLAEKMNQLLSNLEKVKLMGQRGREIVQAKYDWQKIGAQLNKLYKQTTSEKFN
ncbi:MAG: hypothetical protein COT81_00855 [Candidatus Buchananbacteria bacterium CG10_big_fil_rev_8_21_14_0_10_42_9]|uniref:Glycosyltransferase family 1 protein n=1 Tax=Candidatus Buchananbacteria bacterium CG10_big_fil_rev_8_21_14_0_10_42_9 TaxID=1974526 RepID=A0A2H0W2H0_9BACT|nr:MAG: hypothetical protein COT81_00855 [Candidatus Buchananbacteria bacterium CG10_big_fil_rev_8_21_14_0_10_42_9]